MAAARSRRCRRRHCDRSSVCPGTPPLRTGVPPVNPLEEKGIELERQLRNWSELNVEPFDKDEVEPYTRTRVILMNGIEVESILFSHQFARHTDQPELKQA